MSASIDTRSLRPGDTFYALAGEHRDGHEFVGAALGAGAALAVVEAERARQFPAAWSARLRVVADPLQALQKDAQRQRRAWGGPLVAITGSAGKTTTKEMIAAVLGTRMRVLKSEANYNNHLGVPLTLLALRPEHEVAVVEMGMNHAGEIAALARIGEPTMAVFTNVGSAHLGNLGSIEAIAEAKRELARAIPPTGTLVLNRDDVRVATFGEGFGGTVRFYSAEDLQTQLQLPGMHNRANAAAAVAVGELFGIAPDEAARALGAMRPLPGRGEILHHQGMTLIEDCYNANPEAMMRMLAVLAATPAERHIAVLGEMRELGSAAGILHRQVGAAAAASRVDALWVVGPEAQPMREGACAAGLDGPVHYCETVAEVVPALRRFLRPGDAVLFKASHSLHLEVAVKALVS
ncbi:MAG: UDP-N-acetylmuramoyl-tripeptide--D-alanyl-D-alanine ligase [Terriglobales bacterium]